MPKVFAITTDPQLQTLANGIRASTDPAVVSALSIRDDVTIWNWCNASASPVVKAWRVAMMPQDSDEAPDYAAFDTLAAGKRDSWARFLGFQRDFSRQKVRKWVTDIWGNATANSNSEAVLLAATEDMRNCEQILGPGTAATTGTVTANNRTFIGQVTLTEVSTALNRF